MRAREVRVLKLAVGQIGHGQVHGPEILIGQDVARQFGARTLGAFVRHPDVVVFQDRRQVAFQLFDALRYRCLGDVGLREIDPVEDGADQIRPGQIGVVQPRPGQDRTVQDDIRHVGAAQIAAGQIGTGQDRRRHIRPLETDLRQVGVGQVCFHDQGVPHLGMRQVGAGEDGGGQVGQRAFVPHRPIFAVTVAVVQASGTQIRFDQAGMRQVGPAQAGAAQIDPVHLGVGEIGLPQIDGEHDRIGKVGAGQLRVSHVRAGEIGRPQILARQIEIGQVHQFETGPNPFFLMRDEPPVLFEDLVEFVLRQRRARNRRIVFRDGFIGGHVQLSIHCGRWPQYRRPWLRFGKLP